MKGGIIDGAGTLLDWGRQGMVEAGDADFTSWQVARWHEALHALVLGMPKAGTVDAIVISGNGPTLVPMNKNRVAIDPVLLWLDGNEKRIPGEPSFFLPKTAWLRDTHPEIFSQVAFFLSCPDYVSFLLTGEASTVIPSVDFQRFYWAEESLDAYGMSGALFPHWKKTGEMLGYCRGDFCRRLGLKDNTPVFAGGSDFLMALLGTGAVRPGRTCDRAGTSEGINYCSGTPVDSPKLRCLPHAVEGFYNIAGILSSTGRIFEWFRSISGQNELSYEEMLEGMVSIGHTASRPVFLPSLHVGATWEFSSAVFLNLEPDHGAKELGRAVVESIGFSIRDFLETLKDNGCPVSELRVSGGQARNPWWNQMKADITGCTVAVPEVVDAELLGNAAAGLVGLGEFKSLTTAVEEIIRFRRFYEPRPEEYAQFSISYDEYRELCGRIISSLQP